MAQGILERYQMGPQREAPEERPPEPARTGSIMERYNVSAPATTAPPERTEPRRPSRWQQPTSAQEADATLPEVTVRAAPPAPDTLSSEGAKDIAKAAGSGIAMGVLADLPGMVGSLGQLYDIGTQKGREAFLRFKENYGLDPKGTAERAIALAREEAAKGKTAEEIAGDVNRIFGVAFPTAQGMEKVIREVAPELSYAPETRVGKVVGSALRAAPSGVLGGGTGLLARLGIGAAAGAGSEVAGQLAEGTDYETPARIIGSLLGPAGVAGASRAIGAFTGPGTKEVEKQLLTAIARDVASGSSKMTPEQLRKAIESGADVGLFNMAGTETRKLISRLGYATPESQQLLEQLNARIAEQAGAANTAMRSHIGRALNLSDDAYDIQQAERVARQVEVDRLYKALETDPSATSVISSGLRDILQDPSVAKIASRAYEMAGSPRSRIIAPTTIPLQKGSLSSPGNIFFYDQIKRDLDDAINEAYRNGRTNQADLLRKARADLISELDSAAPGYKAARDTASEAFGAQNAVEAGYRALRGGSDAFKSGKVLSAFDKYDDTRKDLFRQGLGSQLAEIAEKNGPDEILKLLKDPNKAKLLQAALSDDQLNSIIGRATSESILKKTRAYSAQMESPDVQNQFFRAQLQFELPQALLSAVRGDFLPILNWSATKGSQVVGGYFSQPAIRKQAETILSLINTEDPAQLQRLGELIRRVPSAQTTLGKITDLMRDGIIRTQIGMPPSQEATAPGAQTTEGSVGMPVGQDNASTSQIFDRMLQVESNKRQFDSQGNVLTSSAGALGIAQVMPTTAPEAARLAGLPYDENRLRNDAEYNAALGRAYFEEQLRSFGDPMQAAAAYNAGPAAVRRALRDAAESGESFLNFLPRETQDYVRKIFGQRTMQAGGRTARATGGKVGVSVGGLVGKLMNAAEAAKKHNSSSTQDFLDVHDDHVAKALEIADKAI